MSRPSWDEKFLDDAKNAARMSTCARIKTGAVVVRDKRIISTGHNGVCSGAQHCEDYYADVDRTTQEFFDEHHKWSSVNEFHAEQNALIYACRSGISTVGATLYTIYSPCIHCAKVIVASGVIRVVYLIEYDRDKSGIEFILRHKINCDNIK